MLRTLVLPLLLLSCTAFAQSGPPADDDPRARAIVDKLMAKAKAWKSFEGDFTSRLESTRDKLDVKQSGTMKVKDKRFHLTLDKNTVISDGKTIWTYNRDNNEVTLSDPAEMDQELDPSKIFTQYEKGFKTQFVEEKTEGGTAMQVVKLFPLEPVKKPYHTVVLTVDKAKNEPRGVQILYKDGNKVTYTLSRFVADPPLPDALFNFDKSKYPGVEVNDMR
ncbi:MAG: outer membrane lipoprotein carrier protein LolA [Flavobacteriales bacterium]|nr:outer membrane lipoprotein carrier protein LolA [Flavobacteriales bacterium]